MCSAVLLFVVTHIVSHANADSVFLQLAHVNKWPDSFFFFYPTWLRTKGSFTSTDFFFETALKTTQS